MTALIELKDLTKIYQTGNVDNKTMIIVTHDPKIAEQCKGIVTLKDGRIVC